MVLAEYCVAPNYTLFLSVVITFSISKPQKNSPLQSVNQLWAVQVCHNSKSVTQFLAVRVLVHSKEWIHDQFCLHSEDSQLLK